MLYIAVNDDVQSLFEVRHETKPLTTSLYIFGPELNAEPILNKCSTEIKQQPFAFLSC